MRPAVAALGLALLMVAVAFALPEGSARAADLTGKYGGDLHMALLAAPSWNPLSTNPADANAHNLVWDTLARPDPTTGEPKPWAASGWTAGKGPGTTTRTATGPSPPRRGGSRSRGPGGAGPRTRSRARTTGRSPCRSGRV